MQPEHHVIVLDRQRTDANFSRAVNWLDSITDTLWETSPQNSYSRIPVDNMYRRTYLLDLMYAAWGAFLINMLNGESSRGFFPNASAREFLPYMFRPRDNGQLLPVDDTTIAYQYFDLPYQPGFTLVDIQAGLSTLVYQAMEQESQGVKVTLQHLNQALNQRDMVIGEIYFQPHSTKVIAMVVVAEPHPDVESTVGFGNVVPYHHSNVPMRGLGEVLTVATDAGATAGTHTDRPVTPRDTLALASQSSFISNLFKRTS